MIHLARRSVAALRGSLAASIVGSIVASAIAPAVVMAALAAGCDDKKVDCEALAAHVAAVPLGRAPAETDEQYEKRVTTVRIGWEISCTSGSVSESEASCLFAARTQDAIDDCVGLGRKGKGR